MKSAKKLQESIYFLRVQLAESQHLMLPKSEGAKPVTVNVQVELQLPPIMKNLNVEKLTREAAGKTYEAINEYLREVACKSAK